MTSDATPRDRSESSEHGVGARGRATRSEGNHHQRSGATRSQTMRDLKDKVALVTGAASGIGRATVNALAAEGARLIVCDVNRQGLDAVAAELGPKLLLSRRVDVSDRAAMRAFADEVHKLVPAIDVLVNNAGVGLAGGISDTTLEDWDWVLSINLYGVIHGCHFFIPPMRRRGAGGHVVNVSSVLGVMAGAGVLGYATSKFAVFGLSESLRSELEPEGIGVSTICPGMIATDIIKGTRFRGVANPDKTRAHTDETFHKRSYPPEKVAAAIVSAILRDRAVVPVAPEAWATYFLKRLAPSLMPRIGRAIARRVRES
jgi:NAD(P)-dependent dehydrogenase (short-subunit alcohol dehydrogenase family)